MISAILLSGGSGRRMGASSPKQYLPLGKKKIILHALEALLEYRFWKEIVIVCEDEYQELFASYQEVPILFASPGKERQDSVFSGLQKLSHQEFVCVHDGARPFVHKDNLHAVIEKGKTWGAATLASPIVMTVKEADENLFVKKTVDRSRLWNIQTPQVLRYEILKKGYTKALQEGLTITDDVGFAEALNQPVKLVPGKDTNIKITTQRDLSLAELLLLKEAP